MNSYIIGHCDLFYSTVRFFFLCVSGLQIQLSETRRELQELKASLRVAQKEKELLQAEKQVRNSSVHKSYIFLVFFT